MPQFHSPPQSPPTQPGADYLGPQYGGPAGLSPAPGVLASPIPSMYQSTHSINMADEHDEDMETGDMPLLRRDNTRSSAGMPGDYQPVAPDDRSENNIRYGRIPQRVPRRYKTIKKVE